MQNQDGLKKTFVVLEAGTEWPRGLQIGARKDIHIVAQQADEQPLQLARRVSERLERAQHSNGAVVAALFVVQSRSDYTAVQQRTAISRLLAVALAATPGSRLLLTGKGLSPECCAHLSVIALALEDELGDALHVSVRDDPAVMRRQSASVVA